MINRPLESVVIQIHEPSHGSEECNSSTLKPGKTVSDSAGVALCTLKTSPHGLSPSLPRLTALVQPDALNSRFCHSFCSLSELNHDGSLTTNSLRLLATLSSSLTSRPA